MYELYKVTIQDHRNGGRNNYYRVLTTNDRAYADREYQRCAAEVVHDNRTQYELK